MKGVPSKPTLREAFQSRFDAALAAEPAERHAFLRTVFDLCDEIERDIRACSSLARDCNIILARTNDKMTRFLATGAPGR